MSYFKDDPVWLAIPHCAPRSSPARELVGKVLDAEGNYNIIPVKDAGVLGDFKVREYLTESACTIKEPI